MAEKENQIFGRQSGKSNKSGQSGPSVYRILDAAINRASEGVRVVEDYARMTIQDEHLTRQLKQLRHDLAQAVSNISLNERIIARDTVGDVGTKIETDSEYVRGTEPEDSNDTGEVGAADQSPEVALVKANLGRAQQALRTIEEFSKTIDASVSKQVEQLRYRAYTIEKAVLTTVFSVQDISAPSLYVLLDRCQSSSGDDSKLVTLVNHLIKAEIDFIQLRDKTLNDRDLVELARKIAGLVRGSKTRFIVNDRPDIAVAAGADGVHVGQEELKVSDARRIVGASKLIGVSTHSIEQARQAVLDGANYIGVGPVFPSSTKSFDSHVGLELVQEVAKEIRLPAFAIGGIGLDNAADVSKAGLSRVAVSGVISQSNDPFDVAQQLKKELS